MVFLVPVLLVFFFILGGTKVFHFTEAKKEYDYLALFSEMVSLVKSDYVEEVQPGEKFPGAFSRMLGTLDKMSTYLDADQTKIYQLYRQGKACSCGIYGARQYNYFLITDIIPNSPADVQRLKPGDTIRAINGKSIFGKSYWEVYLSLLSGKPETIEILLLQDEPGSAAPSKIQLNTVELPSGVTVKKMGKKTYLVELPRLDTRNAAQLEQELKSETSPPSPLKLIIDLRKYSGGDLEGLLQFTRLFFPSPLSLTLKTKYREEKISLGSDRPFTYRAVVIINKSTRMYGELLAALFKEYGQKHVTLLGNKTKGMISKLGEYPLQDGSSILLTEGVFLIKGKNPAQNGVSPDVKIDDQPSGKILERALALLDETHD